MKTINLFDKKLSVFKIMILLTVGSTVVSSNSAEPMAFIQIKDHFPVIAFTNPAGNAVVITPVSPEKGSIGFEHEGKLHWLIGIPKHVDTSSSEQMKYVWNAGNRAEIVMYLTRKHKDIRCRLLKLNHGEEISGKWLINVSANEDEYFTGLFERVVDGHQKESWKKGIKTALNLRGQRMDMKLKPTVSAYAPFYISSNNYGFFVYGSWPGTFDFCSESDVVQIAFEGKELDFKLYFGTPMEIVQKHALETGPSFCPPDWAFGPWRWRDEHVNRKRYYDGTKVKAPYNSETVEDILIMKALDIPCTAYWVDRPWAKGSRGFDDYEFDPVRFPEPERMIRWINRHHMEFMLWIAPWVMGTMADEVVKNNYYLQSRDFVTATQILMDFTNPEAREWWSEKGPEKLAKMGVRGFKLDRADGEKLLDSLDLTTHAGTTYRENYNDYPRQYVETTFNAVKSALGDNFILFPRAQYTGSARYGGMWAGDTDGGPEGLRSAIIGLQRCAVMGYPVWGSDTGGYWGDFSRETCMRWLAFSCFTPIMEVGPTNNKGFWDNPDKPHYDVELIAVWRQYAKIRMKLQPLIHSLAKEASMSGTPIVRPLFLVYPDQAEAWKDWQTFLLGQDILVSAIWESGVQTHQCYLPSGQNWINAWKPDQLLEGGQIVEVETPVYKIPIFIREGSPIDLGDLEALHQESLTIAAQKPDLSKLEKAEEW